MYGLDPARAAGFSGPYAFDVGGAFEVMQRYSAELLAQAESAARAAGVTRVAVRLVDRAPIDAILAAVATERGDAVIIGTHGRHGFNHAVHGSITEELIRKSPVPVLALHTPAPAVA